MTRTGPDEGDVLWIDPTVHRIPDRPHGFSFLVPALLRQTCTGTLPRGRGMWSRRRWPVRLSAHPVEHHPGMRRRARGGWRWPARLTCPASGPSSRRWPRCRPTARGIVMDLAELTLLDSTGVAALV